MDHLLNAYDYYRPGGMIMVVLVMISLWMWGLVFERLLFFRRMNYRDADVREAVALLSRGVAGSPAGCGICRQLISTFSAGRTGDSALNQRMIEEQALRQRPRLRRFLPVITILAATAPMLGLLGTVSGMVASFDVLTVFGTGNAKALSGGISKALITTQSGLLVGIPGLFMGRMLSRRAHAIERRLTETVLALKRAV
jgi:biopolymer transport protein ExbB